MKMQGYCNVLLKDYFGAYVDRSTCLHATSSKSSIFEQFDVRDMICPKFSYCAVFYKLSGKNVKVLFKILNII